MIRIALASQLKDVFTILWLILRFVAQSSNAICQGWPNCGSGDAYGSSNLCMRLLELSEKLYICSLFFISIAKCRNIVKWYCGS